MACFIVPAAEAVITTGATMIMKSKEKESATTTKLGWLNKLLWGGSALLAFEHIWHGEVVPFFPFLTAVENGETAEMLSEMGSSGVAMAVLVTAVWAGMLVASKAIEKRSEGSEKINKEGA